MTLSIPGYCHTNLDEYQRCTWPKRFVAVPRLGEHVQTTSRPIRVLKVVYVTHLILDGEPAIEVELHR